MGQPPHLWRWDRRLALVCGLGVGDQPVPHGEQTRPCAVRDADLRVDVLDVVARPSSARSTSRSAISWFESPSATSRSTSTSRDGEAGGPVTAPPYRWPAARSTASTASPSSRPAVTSARRYGRRLLGRQRAGGAAAARVMARYDVGGGQDAPPAVIADSPEAARIAGAVEPLVVLDGDRAERREGRREGEHALAQVRMQADPLHLRRRERPPLVPDRVRDPEAAEVVHQPGPADRAVASSSGSPEIVAAARRQVRHPPRVPDRVRRLEVGEVADRLEDGVELLVGEDEPPSCGSAAITASQSSPIEVVEQHAGARRQKSVHQRRVELRAAALLRDRDGRRRRPRPDGRPSTTSARFTSRDVSGIVLALSPRTPPCRPSARRSP